MSSDQKELEHWHMRLGVDRWYTEEKHKGLHTALTSELLEQVCGAFSFTSGQNKAFADERYANRRWDWTTYGMVPWEEDHESRAGV